MAGIRRTTARKRKMYKSEQEPIIQESLFGDANYDNLKVLTEVLDTSQRESVKENPRPKSPTEAEVLNIYKDLSKLADIERYLNVLFRPVTCFIKTECNFNLRSLRLCLPDSIYDPDRHLALVTTHLKPMATIKIYANGNIYCQSLNQETALQAVTNFADALAELCGYSPSVDKATFNLVNATFCMPFPLDLQAFKARNNRKSVYTPKTQPFLSYILPKMKFKFAIFPVGYVYVMCCTGLYMTRQAIAFILPKLYACRAASQQNQSDLELSLGDINYKLLWEKKFQSDGDLSIQWPATPP